MSTDEFNKQKAELDNAITEQQSTVSTSAVGTSTAGTSTAGTSTAGTSTGTTVAETTWWSTTNAMTISSCVLAFGLIVCFMAASLMRAGKSADAVLKTMGTILIIVSALFLVVAGYDNQQISPVIGLLGTIAGYLLGKNGSSASDPAPPAPSAAPSPTADTSTPENR